MTRSLPLLLLLASACTVHPGGLSHGAGGSGGSAATGGSGGDPGGSGGSGGDPGGGGGSGGDPGGSGGSGGDPGGSGGSGGDPGGSGGSGGDAGGSGGSGGDAGGSGGTGGAGGSGDRCGDACDTGLAAGCADGILECSGTVEDCVPRDVAGCTPPVPVLLTPAAGAYTGTSLGGPLSAPLTPTFTWNPVPMANRYELQIADACTPGELQSCTFDPDVYGATVAPSDTPHVTGTLAVSTTPPVGRFYAWRVRACQAALCSAWTSPRGLHVGRLPDDFDGDGRSDALLAGNDQLHVRYHDRTDVLDGASLGTATFGTAVAAAGDVNGDGFADAVVSGTAPDGSGEVFVLLGGEQGLSTERRRTSKKAGDYGAVVAAAGDLDEDGLDDVAVGAPDQGTVTVQMGNEAVGPVELTGLVAGDRFGAALAQGYVSVGEPALMVGVPGAQRQVGDKLLDGAVLFYPGGPSGLGDPGRFESLEDVTSCKEFGTAVACTPRGPGGLPACAVAGRYGFAPNRVFLCSGGSCPSIAGGGTGGGALAFLQGAGPLDLLAVGNPASGDPDHAGAGRVILMTLEGNPLDSVLGGDAGTHFGASLATGDFEGTGSAQLLVGAPGAEQVHVFADGLVPGPVIELPGIGQVIGG